MIGGSVTGFTPDQGVETNVGGLVGQNTGAVTTSFSTAASPAKASSRPRSRRRPRRAERRPRARHRHVQRLLRRRRGQGAGARQQLRRRPRRHQLRRGQRSSAPTPPEPSPPTTPTGGIAGGLAGENLGAIDQSYATGAGQPRGTPRLPRSAASSARPRRAAVAAGAVANSFWDITTTAARPTSAGGGTPPRHRSVPGHPLLHAPSAEAAGWSFTDTWAPPDPGHYPELYSRLHPSSGRTSATPARTYGFRDPAAGHPERRPRRLRLRTARDRPDRRPRPSPRPPRRRASAPTPSPASADSSPATAMSATGSSRPTASSTVTPARSPSPPTTESKLYGQSLSFRGTEFTAKGLVNGDTVTSVDLASLGASRGANVGEGPFRITASNAEGREWRRGMSNYTISYVPGTADRRPRPCSRHRRTTRPSASGRTFVFNGTEFTRQGPRQRRRR